MLGLRVGTKAGPRVGLAVGVGADPVAVSASMAGVSRDATSLKYVPNTSAEWTTTLAAAGLSSGGPSALWRGQEAAGNIADSIGAFTLTASSINYQIPVAGWTRVGFGATAEGAGSASLVGAAIGDTATVSGLMLAYIAITATPGATRDVMGLGGSSTYRGAQVTTTPVYRAVSNDASATANGAQNAGTAVRPVIVHVNRTAGTWRVITNQEIITPSPYTAPPVANSAVFIGSALVLGTTYACLYATCFRGAAAELSDAQIRTLLTTLGWTVAW